MIVSFFGASVTQQKNGYVDKFSELTNENNIIVKKYGYGSMHINDAGICFINNVICNKPNYCFIDWFSTGFICSSDYIKQFIDTIVLKLIKINCTPVFLLFDRKDMCQNRLNMYDYVINYGNKHNIKYISITNNDNIDELLRDTVHTTEIGSLYYGKKIYDYFMINLINSQINDSKIIFPEKNQYYDIKVLQVNLTIYDEITLYGNAKIIGIYQKIGPYSGLVDIITGDNITKYLIWDQWCNYERNNRRRIFIFMMQIHHKNIFVIHIIIAYRN
jgi:hypothetical protein